MEASALSLFVGGEGCEVVVFNHGIDDIEVRALASLLTGILEGVVAAAYIIAGVPGCVVVERQADGREVAEIDPTPEDGGGELLGGDPGCEGWAEELVERMAGSEEAAEGGDGHVVADSEDEFTGQLREGHLEGSFL